MPLPAAAAACAASLYASIDTKIALLASASAVSTAAAASIVLPKPLVANAVMQSTLYATDLYFPKELNGGSYAEAYSYADLTHWAALVADVKTASRATGWIDTGITMFSAAYCVCGVTLALSTKTQFSASLGSAAVTTGDLTCELRLECSTRASSTCVGVLDRDNPITFAGATISQRMVTTVVARNN
jgi:hypothetical protein